MRPRNRFGSGLVLLAAVYACGGNSGQKVLDAASDMGGEIRIDASMEGTPPDTGTDQIGVPTDAAGETDGIARSDAPTVLGGCLGTCLEVLFAQCPRGGVTCTSSTVTVDITHYTETECYANGVKRREVVSDTIVTRTVKKANGEVCYEAMLDTAASSQDFSDAAGNFVARMLFGIPMTQVMVTCADGTTKSADLAAPECAPFAGSTCAAGSCTW